jgi:hypothetical protein
MSVRLASNERKEMMEKKPILKKNSLHDFTLPFLVCLIVAVLTPSWAPGAAGKSSPFPEIQGWKQSGEILTFSPRKLYDYINGAADLYLKYDFQELKVAEYQNEKKASVTVEVYRHKTPTHAFGIYSQERFGNANYLDIGAQGYSEKGVLNFVAGNYYVKMNIMDSEAGDEEVLLTLAKKVVENLGGKGSLPSILSSFPEERKKKNSEKFIAKNFLGYSFLHSGFTADYELSGKKFKLYVIEGADQKDCRNMVQEYLQQTGNLQKKVEEGHYTLKDPYHGEMDFYWMGQYIWGALNLEDSTLRSKYLRLLEEGLQKKK